MGGVAGGVVGGGGPLVAGADGFTTTTSVTVLVSQVVPVQPGVPLFVNTATFLITWPLVSVALTVTLNVRVTAWEEPVRTSIPLHVTVVPLSVQLEDGLQLPDV